MSVFVLVVLKCDEPECSAECNGRQRVGLDPETGMPLGDRGGIEALEPGWPGVPRGVAGYAPWFCPEHKAKRDAEGLVDRARDAAAKFTPVRPAIVLARNARDAEQWAKRYGLGPREYIYIASAERLRGRTIDGAQVVRLEGAHHRPDAAQIDEALSAALYLGPPPGFRCMSDPRPLPLPMPRPAPLDEETA